MRSLWTTAELAVLYAHVNDSDYLWKVALPGRTRPVIQNRMARLRREAGINIRAAEYGLEQRHG